MVFIFSGRLEVETPDLPDAWSSSKMEKAISSLQSVLLEFPTMDLIAVISCLKWPPFAESPAVFWSAELLPPSNSGFA